MIGPGLMGRGIATLFAHSGARVGIVGTSLTRAQDSLRTLDDAGAGSFEAVELESRFVADADLVVESVRETLAEKREVLAAVDAVNSGGLLVTNTSSLDLDALSEVLSRPQRFAGMHFLNPPTETWVIEVVGCRHTEPAELDSLCEVTRGLGRLPLVLHKPVAGYVWNRLQFALLRECLHLLEEGVCDVDTIDAAVSEGLAPRWLAVGPLGTVDLGGPAVFGQIAAELFPLLGCEPGLVDAFPESGGAGFHSWSPDERGRRQRLRVQALRMARDLRSTRALAPEASR